ncbi:MAG: hypothetical protein LHW64_01590 [Candidatus Cloacimonetes bacterium]|nr:hypothetical protein [Candidatus Cloacimonadota bacterium]MCB5286478.1 hypothetical protein [Candidatus Cloacimonadota bacterium]MCK9183772.1 hypothetical protein [Candidatus Cloacimonadota bacterium]MCK9583480.1 hypothetical protein [Candidatus Cloacimonadota bacterium]MDY0228800.1 hypothetical protein [Candidatus Cloacimonadaceae bacterium]
MKTRIVIAMVLILLLSLVACKKKVPQVPSDELAEQQITYAPLPSFKEVYVALDQVQVKDISAAVPTTIYKTKQEEVRNAFSLGLLTADAVLAAKGRNKSKLTDISASMMNLTSLLGLESEVNRLGDQMKKMIENEQWEELDKALDFHKGDVEGKLWESENFDNYTLMLLGGWVEAANRVAWLIHQDYNAERTSVLAQKGTFNSLVQNMQQISTPHIVEQEAFTKSIELLKDVKAIIDSDQNKVYTKDQLKLIITKTDEIKAVFQK